MRDSKFIRRLQKELPVWAEHGWVRPEHQQDILAYAATQSGGGTSHLTLALGVMGAILLGSGVITFFAANWGAMTKLAKLAVLFGGMWAAYAGSGLLMARGSQMVGHAVLLLAVILFGANIALVAQIYHIDSHYPDGVLTWSLGALLAGWLMSSQPALAAGLLLGILWTGMEGFGFGGGIHWPFLLLWTAFLVPILRHRWRIALHFALVGLLFWSWETFWQTVMRGQGRLLAQVAELFLLSYLALFLIGKLMALRPDAEALSSVVQRYASFAVLACFYVLTFPALRRWEYGHAGAEKAMDGEPSLWLMGNFLALAVVAGLAWLHHRSAPAEERPPHFVAGQALLAAVAALLAVNLFAPPAWGGALALLFNLAYFASVVWLVYSGLHTGNRSLVNQAFGFFALWVLARYFDTFWTLFDRSFFFMGGGLLLLLGGYFLERQRRRLNQEILLRGEGGK